MESKILIRAPIDSSKYWYTSYKDFNGGNVSSNNLFGLFSLKITSESFKAIVHRDYRATWGKLKTSGHWWDMIKQGVGDNRKHWLVHTHAQTIIFRWRIFFLVTNVNSNNVVGFMHRIKAFNTRKDNYGWTCTNKIISGNWAFPHCELNGNQWMVLAGSADSEWRQWQLHKIPHIMKGTTIHSS